MIELGVHPGRRDVDGGDGCRAFIGCQRDLGDINRQRQRPADFLLVQAGFFVVVDDGWQGGIRMRPGERIEPANRGWAVLGERDAAFRRDVMDHIQFMVGLGDHALIAWAGVNVHGVLDIHVAQAGDRGPLPVFAALPQNPLAVGINVLERVGAQTDRRVEFERHQVCFLFKNVLGHHVGGAPAHSEGRVEARVGGLQVNDDRVFIWLFQLVYIAREQAITRQSLCLHNGIDGVEHVIARELHAIAPIDALADFYGHLGEVVIVDRLLGCQGIIPYAVDSRIRVNVPQRIQGQLLESTYPEGTIAAPPAVEVICRLHSP